MKNNPSVEKTFFCLLGGEEISPISTLFHHSRARVRAHYRSFRIFAVTSVTLSIQPTDVQSIDQTSRTLFAFYLLRHNKTEQFRRQKTHPKNKILVHFRRTR